MIVEKAKKKNIINDFIIITIASSPWNALKGSQATKTRYMTCEDEYRLKIWFLCSNDARNFKMAIAKH
jgi:hypothetical protein